MRDCRVENERAEQKGRQELRHDYFEPRARGGRVGGESESVAVEAPRQRGRRACAEKVAAQVVEVMVEETMRR